MLNAWRRTVATGRRIFRLLVLFAVLRLVAGIALLALFDRDAIAWGYEATLVVIAAIVVYLLVALAVRHGAPPSVDRDRASSFRPPTA